MADLRVWLQLVDVDDRKMYVAMNWLLDMRGVVQELISTNYDTAGTGKTTLLYVTLLIR